MSLHSTDLVFLTFMCCKPLGRGEGAATKAGVLNIHLVSVIFQAPQKRRAALQDVKELLIQPLHLLHHLLLSLKSPI